MSKRIRDDPWGSAATSSLLPTGLSAKGQSEPDGLDVINLAILDYVNVHRGQLKCALIGGPHNLLPVWCFELVLLQQTAQPWDLASPGRPNTAASY
jgi:hypothetical protein